MGRLKAILIIAICVAFALIFGLFLIQNDHDIMVDLLIRTQQVETSVGRFALSFFMAGLGVGLLLCFGLTLIQNLQIRAARREIRQLSSQLDKLRELSLKDAA
jgi:uncharacterized membrane protein YciS (DUF1049 family)